MKKMNMLSCAAMVLLSPDGADGGVMTKALPELEFQNKVLAKQAENKKTLDDLTLNVGNLQKETKSAMEEFTLAKNKGADIETLSQSMQKLTLQMNREKRLAFGPSTSVQRINSDPVMKASFNAVVRHACSMNNDLHRVADTVAKAIGEDTSPGSNTLVPQLMLEMYDTLAKFGKWNTFGVRPMGTKITQLPIETARPVAYCLTAEAAAIAEDTAKAGALVTLTVVPIAVLLSVSLQLLQDAEFDITANLLNDFYEAYNYRLDFLTFQGNGTMDQNNGGQTGVFNTGVASVAATGHTSIASMSFEDFTKCLLTPDEGVLDRETRWWSHPFNLIQALSVKDANGRPIFLTALEAPTPNALGSILGSPVTTAHAAPKAIGVNPSTAVMVFGDPQGHVVGPRQDFMFEASNDFKFANLQRVFRGWGRAGVQTRRAQAFSVLTTPAS
jgi:HK97 family phage major capsid protein